MAALLLQGLVLFPVMSSTADSSGMLFPLLLIPAAQLAAVVAMLLGRGWGYKLAVVVSGLLAVLSVPFGFVMYLAIASSLDGRNWWALVGVVAYLALQVTIMAAADAAGTEAALA